MRQKLLWGFIFAIGFVVYLQRIQIEKESLVTPLPNFLRDQIHEDLSSVVITKEDIDITWKQARSNSNCIFVRYKSLNGVLAVSVSPQFMNDRRYVIVTQALQKIFKAHPFLNLDFIVCYDDSLDENRYTSPIFAFASKNGAKNVILMPDPTALDPSDREYINSVIFQGGKKYDWPQKNEAVFWRGAPTGPIPFDKIQSDEWNHIPRVQLVKLSATNPLIDAGFTAQADSPAIASKFPIVPNVNPKDHLRYKYLIDIDGNSCCYSRTFWILLSNSLMLKQITDNRQWFYKGLQPYVHYVPIKDNLENLMETIEWCKAHDKQAQEISRAGTDFALKYLQYDENLLYFSELLNEYAKHLQFKPTLEKEDITNSIVPLYGRIYHTIKGFLRKKTNKPIASLRPALAQPIS